MYNTQKLAEVVFHLFVPSFIKNSNRRWIQLVSQVEFRLFKDFHTPPSPIIGSEPNWAVAFEKMGSLINY